MGCCLQVAGVWNGLSHMGGCWLGDGDGRGVCFSSSSGLALLVKCHSHGGCSEKQEHRKSFEALESCMLLAKVPGEAPVQEQQTPTS